MVTHYELSKFPPIRGLLLTPDSLASNIANPFTDLEGDLPQEGPRGKKP